MVSMKLVYAATLVSLALAQGPGGGKQAGFGGGFGGGKGRGGGGRGGGGGGNNNNAADNAVATSTAAAAAATSSTPAVAAAADNNNKNNNNDATATAGNGDSLTLEANAVQSGSFVDGQSSLGADAGQASSTTSQNNFINFCSGQTLTNGLQNTDGSCNGIVMGQIPAKAKMISTVITFPQDGASVKAGEDFDIKVQVANLQAGSFTNAVATYYAAPQQLSNGEVIGHTHITVQDMGNTLNPTTPPDATQFAFFKGINDAGDGNGGLTAAVAGGLPAGNYRVCTMTSAANHQPVIMPVAQRGSQDDCTRFTVTGNGGATNDAANDGAKGEAAAAAAQSAVDAGPGALATGTAAAPAATSAAADTNNNNKGNKKAKGGKNAKRMARFRSRTFVA